MPFVEPFLLWGALAVAIPIVVHFWHQKQGKPLPWAATQWLTERDQQQSRGLRLDAIWLLLVRCLLLLVLALLLSQLILTGLTKPDTIRRIHIVQANPLVTGNFRFELDEAAKNGEKTYQIDKSRVPLPNNSSPKSGLFNPLTLQTAISRLPAENTELHLYVVNSQVLASVPAIVVPARFRLHTVIDSTPEPRAFLTGRANNRLFINQAGKLTGSTVTDPALTFRSAPARSGPIRVLLDYPNQRERQTVRAALNALTDVYPFSIQISEKRGSAERCDLIFTNSVPDNAETNPATLYIVSGIGQTTAAANIIFTNESLTPQTSERVATGQLPEWIGEQIVRHYGLDPAQQPLSQPTLNALFIPTTQRAAGRQPLVQDALLLLFVSLLGLERWLALTKNA